MKNQIQIQNQNQLSMNAAKIMFKFYDLQVLNLKYVVIYKS